MIATYNIECQSKHLWSLDCKVSKKDLSTNPLRKIGRQEPLSWSVFLVGPLPSFWLNFG